MECVMEAVVEAQHVGALEHLTRGITGAQPRPVYTHEQIFRNLPGTGAGPCELRLSCPLGAPAHSPWTVTHEGGAMRGTEAARLAAQVRSVLRADASPTVGTLVHAMGMRLEHEYLRQGTSFTFRHRGSVLTLSVVRVLPPVSDAEVPVEECVVLGGAASPLFFAPLPGLHFCDLTAAAAPASYATVSATLLSFAEMLAPLITFSKPGVPAGIPATAAAAAAAIAPAGLT